MDTAQHISKMYIAQCDYEILYLCGRLCRRVAFPMGAFGSPTMKMTVSLGGILMHFKDYIVRMLLVSISLNLFAPPASQPSLWGTLPQLSSLHRALTWDQLKLALQRTGSCGAVKFQEPCLCAMCVLSTLIPT